MSIRYRIDHDRRLVIAVGFGTMTDEDVYGYQLEVWSQPPVLGYDELIDMSQVERIAVQSPDRVQGLATTAAAMDPRARKSRFAIVAPSDVAFGLGRMFQTYRAMDPRSTKQVAVFRSMPEALEFLRIDGEVPLPPIPASPEAP